VFFDWTAAGCGRTVEYFLVAQAKTTVQHSAEKSLATTASNLGYTAIYADADSIGFASLS